MEYHNNEFTKEEVIKCFEMFSGNKTFEEVDVNNVFKRQKLSKGILGDVIEQSVLKIKKNSEQRPDLTILQHDGTFKRTELKVTGVCKGKESKLVAKEPASITAVSIGKIEKEDFLNSNFYHKIAHMLWVFYYYKKDNNKKDNNKKDNNKKDNNKKDNNKKVTYEAYKNFPILGYKFLDIADDENELTRFKNDWLLTQQFIIEANKTENPDEVYPFLHESIKKKLFYIDIAPRYKKGKNSPRFRFKKSYVDAIFHDYYYKSNKQLEILPTEINSYEDLTNKLKELTDIYRGKTINELIKILNVNIKDKNRIDKNIGEAIVVKMFGGNSKKISNIEVFRKIGLIGKTIAITKAGARTEDMKLFTLDLKEIEDSNMPFEDTFCFDYFNSKFLCIVFEENDKNGLLSENKFMGFKIITFDDEFIYEHVKKTYDRICDLINNNKLVESYVYNKKGEIIINKTGVAKTRINFPKSSEDIIFVRGTSGNSKIKPWELKGQSADGSDKIKLYLQQIWIKGSYMTECLKSVNFI